MAIFDALDLLSILDVFSWRSLLPTAIGVGSGLGIYYWSGETPASAAVAFALSFTGLCIGLIWDFSHRRRR